MNKIISIFWLGVFTSLATYAQTSGTLSFNVTLTAHQGGYGAQHVVAIWVVDSTNTFVKTNLRMANASHTIKNHLNTWKASSNLNVVDAVTGATLTSYPTAISITWDGTDINKNIVKDGNYTLWIEESWDDGATATSKTSISFKKSSDSFNLTPSNTANFISMSLNWAPMQTPSNISNAYSELVGITIYPNPAHSSLFINFKNLSQVKEIAISDLNGKLVLLEPIDKALIGTKSIKIQGIKTGFYLVSVRSVNGEILNNSKVYFIK
jgi:hypothetical protein